MIRVAGLDLSMRASGVTVLQAATPGELPFEERLWALPVFKRIGEDGSTKDTARVRAQRVERLAQTIVKHVGRVDYAVIEAGSFASKKVQRSLSEERAALRLRIIGLLDCPVVEVAPGTLKVYATGSGTADKAAVVSSTLALYELGTRDDNLIDSFVLARMGARHLGHPIEDHTEEHHERAVKVPRWEDTKWTTK